MYIIKDKTTKLQITFEPLNNLDAVISYSDTTVGENSETYFEKLFKYSIDNISFSDPQPLIDENLASLELDSTQTYYFVFDYVKIGTGELVFTDFSLSYVEASLPMTKKVNQNCCELVTDQVQSYIGNKCDLRSIFNPAKLDQTYELTNQLNTWISGQYGHCVKYYRVSPEESSRDVILKEYSLYDVVEVKEINVVVPDNEFPDNAPQFQPFDMDFLEMPWDVQIGVREWCNVFGDNTNPKRQDILYFPITNRIYEIESAYFFKDFVSKGTYWKIALVKYQDKVNRDFSESVEETIEHEFEEMTKSVDDAFGKERVEEIEKIVKTPQYEVIGLGEYDSTRLGLAKGLEIRRENLENNYTVFSKFNYNLSTASAEYVSPYESVAVEYRAKPELQVNENLGFTAWFRIDDTKLQGNKSIASISPFSADQALIEFNFDHGFLTGEIVKISGINDVNGLYEVEVKSDSEILIRKQLSGSYLQLSGVTAQKQLINNILYGYDLNEEKGIVVGVMNTGLVVKFNSRTYTFEFDFERDKWYATVINFGNIFNQVSAFIYDRSQPQGSSKLNKLYENTQVLAKGEFSLDDTYKVLGGNLSLTNLRLFEKAIEPEAHSNILSQYVVKDNQLSIIIDNAVDPLRLNRSKQTR